MTDKTDLTAKAREIALIERLAKVEHDRWSRWHRHAYENWTPRRVKRWNELASTLYAELTEELKEKDRQEVKHYWALIATALSAEYQRGLEDAAKIVHDEIDQVRYGSIERAEARIRAKARELK